MGGCGLDSSGPGEGPVAGCFEHGSEMSVCIKDKKLFDWLSDFQLLKKNFASWCYSVRPVAIIFKHLKNFGTNLIRNHITVTFYFLR